MTRSIRFVLLIAMFFLLAPGLSYGQKDSIPRIIPGIQQRLNEIIVANKKDKQKVKSASDLKDMVLSNSDLYNKLMFEDNDYETTFLLIKKNLYNDNDSLSLVEAMETLQAINASIGFGLGRSSVPELEVIVTTVDRNFNPVSGYYVYWNFWLDKNNAHPASNFNSITNPTVSGYLRAGIYDIWVQKLNDPTRFPAATNRIKTTVSVKKGEETIHLKIITQ